MMFFDDSLLMIGKDGDEFHCTTLGGKPIVDIAEQLNHLHAAISQYAQTTEINYRDKVNYLGPIKYNDMVIASWNDLELSIIAINPQYPVQWIFDAITYLRIEGLDITPATILNVRYSFPALAVDSLTNELFYTFPPTTFIQSIISQESSTFTLYAVDSVDSLKSVIQLLNEHFPLTTDEHLLVHLNFLFALHYLPNYEQFTEYIPVEFQKLRDTLANREYSNLLWVFDVLVAYYFSKSINITVRAFEDEEVPTNMILLAKMLNIPSGDPESQLAYLQQVSTVVSKNPNMYQSIADLYLQMADLYFTISDFAKATSYYSYACNFYKWIHIECLSVFEKYIQAAIEHYQEYAIAANLTYYAGQVSDSVKFAWQALNIALQLLHDAINGSVDISSVCKHILQFYPMCKRPLIHTETDMSPVIQLKLDELAGFLQQLSIAPVEDAETLIEMHQESLKFLMPQAPPLFLFLTVDGRLLYNVRATADLEAEDLQITHLMAGVLTAVRSIFLEASFSGSESVKEINTGDSVLLIEARENVVVVASAPTLTQEIKVFTANIATEVEVNFAQVISGWFGSSHELTDLIAYINDQISRYLLD